MSNLFNSTLLKAPRQNVFNMGYDFKFSCKFGQLVPIHVQECLPSDRWTHNAQAMIRFAPMLAPIMHQVDCYTHFFFVPNRILWPEWERFITGTPTPGPEPNDIVPPWIALTDAETGNSSLPDYMGMPSSDAPLVGYSDTTTDRPDRQLNALPFAAYQRIWLEYFRDRNVTYPSWDREQQMLSSGQNTYTAGSGAPDDWSTIRYRSWTKDYFASALPWPQQGLSMMIPFGFDEDTPVYTLGVGTGSVPQAKLVRTTGAPMADGNLLSGSAESALRGSGGGQPGNFDAEASGWMARTSELSLGSGSIEDLRTAFRLQEWLERNARGGTRYVESILAHFGKRVRDYRLDRPELIGGGVNRVQISEVLQTADTPAEGTALATMAGHGISAGYSGRYRYTCEEHGWIIGIMSVRPRPAYFQGMPRHFTHRKDRLDYYWSSFAHLGEMPIYQSELVYSGDSVDVMDNEDVFGYTPQYSDYRMNYSKVAGDFNTTLDFWTLARKFPAIPSLTEGFLSVASPAVDEEFDRIFAVQDGTDYLWCHVAHDIKALRPMPRFAIPNI